MRFDAGPTTAQLLETFTDEVASHGGRVTDAADDGRRLIARSILPSAEDVRPKDRVQGGVAIRATGGEVWVHPYLFRLVCKNGAIMAQSIGTMHLEGLHVQDTCDALRTVSEAVGACCAPEVFAGSVERVRSAADSPIDVALTLMPLMKRLTALRPMPAGAEATDLMKTILDHLFRDGDRSRFGLANAITATAREIRDPDLRWELEEYGGAIAVDAVRPLPGHGGLAAARGGRSVLVGSA
jgi:hypothetical protein